MQTLLGVQGTQKAGVNPSDRSKGNSKFVSAAQLKAARCQMALLPLTGNLQLFVGPPWGSGPGRKMKHRGEEQQEVIWP